MLAQQEAHTLKHNYIGTEHILLGLLAEEEGLGARVLESLDITAERVRMEVVRLVGSGEQPGSGQMPLTPRAKKLLELALREALSLGHDYIGTEHLLLGLARENGGVAARILLDFGADSDKIRNMVMRVLSGPGGRRESAVASGPTPTGPGALKVSTGDTMSPDLTSLSDDELHQAIDDAIDELIAEERQMSSRRRIQHDEIDVLRGERNRRRRHDHE